MSVYSLVRFAVRAETRDAVERALHDHASFVRRDLAAVTFVTTTTPHLDGELVVEGCDLVTSSDLGRRQR